MLSINQKNSIHCVSNGVGFSSLRDYCRQISIWLFVLALILLPFDDLPYFKKFFGELALQGAFYPLSLACLVNIGMFCFGNKVVIPKHTSVICLILFLVWIGLSSGVNFQTIHISITKGRTGTEKLLLQSSLVIFVFLSSLVIYNIVQSIPQFFLVYRKYILLSFIIVAVYCLVELLALFDNVYAQGLIQFIGKYIRGNDQPVQYFGRIRSVSGEASWFAIFCGFVFPWILSYVYTAKKCFLALGVSEVFFILIMFTFSRTSYCVVLVQLILFLLLAKAWRNKTPRAILLVILFILTWLSIKLFQGAYFYGASFWEIILSLFGKGGWQASVSNMSRYGSMVAAFNMWLDHIIFGVGLGQYGFHMVQYIPDWAKHSLEIRSWMSPVPNTPWAPVHNIYARILCELGIGGFIIWLVLWLSILYSSFKKFISKNKLLKEIDIYGIAVIVSIVGALLFGLSVDTFKLFEYWITLGVAWFYIAEPTLSSQLIRSK